MKLQLRVLRVLHPSPDSSSRTADTLGLDKNGDNDNDEDDDDDGGGDGGGGGGGSNGADGGDARNPGCRGNVRGQTEPQ